VNSSTGLLLAVVFFAVGLVDSGQVARADDTASQIESVVTRAAPAIVTVKVVMKTRYTQNGQGQDVESRVNLQGAVVDKSGLVMISNGPFSPARLMGLLGQGGAAAKEIKSAPVDFKVIFEEEDKEYPAFLAATDSNLDLAFVKVEDLGDKKLTAIDFSSGANPTIGQEIVTVSRLEKGYDYAPYILTARIGGIVDKPRKAYLLSGSGNFGLPMFTLAGETLGVVTTVESGVQSDAGMTDYGTMMRFYSGGGGLLRAFIVPSAAVSAVIAQARVRAVSIAEDRAKKKASGTDTAKKASTTKSAPAKP